MKFFIFILLLNPLTYSYGQVDQMIIQVGANLSNESRINFVQELDKLNQEVVCFESCEIFELNNIKRIKEGGNPIFLDTNRSHILERYSIDYNQEPTYQNDYFGAHVYYPSSWSALNLGGFDSLQLLLQFTIERQILKCELVGVFLDYDKIEIGGIVHSQKSIFFNLRNSKIKFRHELSLELGGEQVENVDTEIMTIVCGSCVLESEFSFEYFSSTTQEELNFLKDNNLSGKMTLIFKSEKKIKVKKKDT